MSNVGISKENPFYANIDGINIAITKMDYSEGKVEIEYDIGENEDTPLPENFQQILDSGVEKFVISLFEEAAKYKVENERD